MAFNCTSMERFWPYAGCQFLNWGLPVVLLVATAAYHAFAGSHHKGYWTRIQDLSFSQVTPLLLPVRIYATFTTLKLWGRWLRHEFWWQIQSEDWVNQVSKSLLNLLMAQLVQVVLPAILALIILRLLFHIIVLFVRWNHVRVHSSKRHPDQLEVDEVEPREDMQGNQATNTGSEP